MEDIYMRKNIGILISVLLGLAVVMQLVSCSNSDNDDNKITITYESGVYSSIWNSELRKRQDYQTTFTEKVESDSQLKLKNVAELGWETVKQGYTIDYWQDSKQNKTYEVGETVQFSDDVTLKAHWTNKVVTVTFNKNGGEITETTQTSPKSYFTLTNASTLYLYRIGYTFKGWSKSESAETVDFEDGASITTYDDITLYAVWEENPKLTVTFSANGGTIETQMQTIEDIEEIKLDE